MAYPARQTVSAYARDAQKAVAKMKRGDVKAQRVTPRLRTAIAAMVFEGQTRSQAAETAGMTDDALRKALLKPVVLAHLNEQMEVLRTGARPKALNRIVSLIDQADSERVQLDAATYIDGMDRHASTVGAQINVQVNNTTHVEVPGYVIDLSEHPQQVKQIDHLPPHDANALRQQQDVPEDE